MQIRNKLPVMLCGRGKVRGAVKLTIHIRIDGSKVGLAAVLKNLVLLYRRLKIFYSL